MNVYSIIGWVLVVPVALVIVFATYKMYLIHSTYRKYQSVNVAPGITGQQAGRQMLDLAGLQAVPVQELREDRKPWQSYYDMTDFTVGYSTCLYTSRELLTIDIRLQDSP